MNEYGNSSHDARAGHDDDDTVWLGQRHTWGGIRPFGLRRADRRQHLYAVGKTGTGKSTLLRNLILQDIAAGEGVGLIDPHGDLADEILDHIPRWRTDHVIYFDPADCDYPVGFNLLRCAPEQARHLVASGVVGAFKSIWRDSWGPRLEYILYAATAALLDCDNATILGVQRVLSDRRYRDWVVGQVKDPAVRGFWQREFANYEPRLMTEAIAPVQNKVGQLLMAAPLRNILGQVRCRFDPAFFMDNGRIFIANLSKGRLGEDKSNLLGAILVNQFQLAAMARATRPENDRRDFYLYIDEFHNFTTDTFASILSESRKYKLCLALSHQYCAQLRDEIREAVFGNVGTLVSFRVGEADGQVLEREYGPGFGTDRFTDLANHEVLVKLLVEGEAKEPFLAKTLPPQAGRHGRRENIIRRSRECYATPRLVVEEKIQRWMNSR
jgi:hypothetical protein